MRKGVVSRYESLQVYYDLPAHLIIGVRTINENDISVNGMKSTAISDLNLKE
ncbi:MAG TPA: hypothetical protein VIX19_12615 [Terriglobales bacterium]